MQTDIENKPDQLATFEKEVKKLFDKLQISTKHNKCFTYEELIVNKAIKLIEFMTSQIHEKEFYLSENDDIMFRFTDYKDMEDNEDIYNQILSSVKGVFSIPTKYHFEFNDSKYLFSTLEFTSKTSFTVIFKKEKK